MSKRKEYVDYIKAIGIILVILGHINFANSFIKKWIYSFHMPLFFFATGLVIRVLPNIKLDTLKTFFLKKCSSLLVPYFLWGLIYCNFTISSLCYLFYGSYQTISSAKSLTSLWFLIAMFVSVIISQLILLIAKKKGRNVTIVISMILLYLVSISLPNLKIGYPWCFNVALVGTAFILFGHLFEKIFTSCKSNIYYCFFLIIVGFIGTLLYHFNPINVKDYILLSKLQIGNPFLFLVVSISGCVMVYGLSKLLDYIPHKLYFLQYIGMNTIVILAVHKPIIRLFELLLANSNFNINLFLTCLGVLIISTFVCKFIYYFAPCLTGKNNNM